jgi:hypothetical protein
MIVAISCGAFFAAMLLGFHFGGEYLYSYRITSTGVEFLLFRAIPLARLRFDNIVGASVVDRADLIHSPIHLNVINRFARNFVLLRRRRGLFRAILISPREPDKFADSVLGRLRVDDPSPSASRE